MESHDPTEFGGSSSNSSDFRGPKLSFCGVVGGGRVGWLVGWLEVVDLCETTQWHPGFGMSSRL